MDAKVTSSLRANEALVKAENAIFLSELIGRIKYQDYKRTVHLLRIYGADEYTAEASRIYLNNLADSIEKKFSHRSVWYWMLRWFYPRF